MLDSSSNRKNRGKILIIRGGAIGDFVLTLPALHLLRDAFPDNEVHILGYRHIVALAEKRFYADAIKSIEYSGLAAFFSRNATPEEELQKYFASFDQIISYLFDPDGIFEIKLREAGAKHILSAYTPIHDGLHASCQLAKPLESLALFLETSEARLYPNSEDRKRGQRLHPCQEAPLIVHPGSGGKHKIWPPEQWETLLKRLLRNHPTLPVLLIGGESDHAVLQKLEASTRLPVVRSPQLTDLAGLLSESRFYLGHDTGVSHMAAAVGAWGMALFGPTDPEIWGPRSARFQILRAPQNDLALLPAELVYERLETCLRQ